MNKVAILGVGESGIGAALLAKNKGAKVFVSDKNFIKTNFKNQLIENNIEFEELKHDLVLPFSPDLVIKSPGISNNSAVVRNFIQNNVEVISEIEFASNYTNSNIIGVTGSNGKTTTSMMIYKIIKDANLSVEIAGNIGKSFSSKILGAKKDNYVLELSSFQLEGIIHFKPSIAVITNLSKDHLDRYNYEFDKYIEAKFKIIKNQRPEDYLIYDSDDTEINKYINKNISKINSTLLPFSLKKKIGNGTYIKDNNIIITIDKKTTIMPTDNFTLLGKHNLKNAMAAATVGQLLKIRKDTIRKSLEHFQAVEHRLEYVLKINKVNYINDSKATNVNATYFALDSMNSPTVWIVGGVDKGNNYEELFSLVHEKVKAIICLGKENSKIIKNFENTVEYIVETQSMSEAIKIAYKIAKPDDNVLLSPACASFDLFEDFEDRGRQFKNEIRKL